MKSKLLLFIASLLLLSCVDETPQPETISKSKRIIEPIIFKEGFTPPDRDLDDIFKDDTTQ